MRIAIASDHAGFELKQALTGIVKAEGHEVLDLGTNSTSPVDYPDYALKVAVMVSKGEAHRGILICGSGVGASVVANKIRGVRAAVCHDSYSAHQGVEHDDMNILCLGSRVIGSKLAAELCRTFMRASFSREERHQRRLEKVKEIEKRFVNPSSDLTTE